MAWTTPETNRIAKIEKVMNKIMAAFSNLASQKQLRTLVVLKQKEIDDLKTRVTALETAVTTLQNNSI